LQTYLWVYVGACDAVLLAYGDGGLAVYCYQDLLVIVYEGSAGACGRASRTEGWTNFTLLIHWIKPGLASITKSYI